MRRQKNECQLRQMTHIHTYNYLVEGIFFLCRRAVCIFSEFLNADAAAAAAVAVTAYESEYIYTY